MKNSNSRSRIEKVIDWTFDNLPFVFIVGGIVFFVVSYLLGAPETKTEFRIGFWPTYAISATILVYYHIKLCKRTDTGKVSTWLAATTYARAFFAMTVWGILLITMIRLFVFDPTWVALMERFSYAIIGGGLAGSVISAAVLAIGFRMQKLNRQIDPRMRLPRSKQRS